MTSVAVRHWTLSGRALKTEKASVRIFEFLARVQARGLCHISLIGTQSQRFPLSYKSAHNKLLLPHHLTSNGERLFQITSTLSCFTIHI